MAKKTELERALRLLTEKNGKLVYFLSGVAVRWMPKGQTFFVFTEFTRNTDKALRRRGYAPVTLESLR